MCNPLMIFLVLLIIYEIGSWNSNHRKSEDKTPKSDDSSNENQETTPSCACESTLYHDEQICSLCGRQLDSHMNG